MKRILAAGALLAFSIASAAAQSFPQTLGPNTVYGRLGISAGPGQAIPFATLEANLSGGETTVNDANYALLAANRTIAYTAISAARTLTLLSASAYQPGTKIYVLDHSGSPSSTKTISVAPTGADTINGANTTTVVVSQPYGITLLETDGVSKWTTQALGTTTGTSVLDYGAKCDNATNDTVAIQAALDSGKPNIYVPSGTCLSAALTIPTTVKLLAGAGTLKASGSITAFGTFLLATSPSSLRIRDITIDVSSSTYSTVNSIAFVTGTNSKVQNVTFANAGRFGVYIGGCAGCAIEGSVIQNFAQSAIFFSIAEGAITNQRIAHNVVTGNASQTGAALDLSVASTDTEVVDNWITGGSAGAFGINGGAWVRGLIARNIIRNTPAEGIAAYGTQTAITDNDLSWDAGISLDYGMSSVAAGDSMVIARNRIYRAGKTAIAVGSTASGYIIEDNQIIDANNTNQATNGNGIEFINSTNSHVVRRNYIRNEGTSLIRYCIREFNTVDSNRFEGNYCYAPVTGDYLTVGTNSKIVWKYDLTALNPNGNITFLGVTATGLTLSGFGSGSLISTSGVVTSLPGTTTTLLHGNAAGAPTFGAVVSADLNITTTTCTNQFLTAISATGTGTCTTDTLASAQHANQGTTTTLLHGNAAGNPSWAAVSLTADITGTLGVGNGGTNCSAASITCFNNITGFTAAGTTGTTSTNLVFSASPTFTGTITAATITASGAITTSLTTDASSISTGALQTAGGLGVTKTAYFGGVGHFTLTSLNSATGAGFWLDSLTTGADRWFFGADAGIADTFRIFSVLSGANLLQVAANATAANSVFTLTGQVSVAGSVVITTAAKTFVLKQGANGAVGTFVCTSGGTITITNSFVAISDAIIISLNTVGGTISTNPTVNAITAATSFTAKCATSDTSTYNYAIIKNGA